MDKRPHTLDTQGEISHPETYNDKQIRDLIPWDIYPQTKHKPHILNTHTQRDQRTHILEYTPTTKSEISDPGKQTPKLIRDLIIWDTHSKSSDLSHLIHFPMNRDLVYCNILPQAWQGPHTFVIYTHEQPRYLTS